MIRRKLSAPKPAFSTPAIHDSVAARVVEVVDSLGGVRSFSRGCRRQVAERDDVAGWHEVAARPRQGAALADDVHARAQIPAGRVEEVASDRQGVRVDPERGGVEEEVRIASRRHEVVLEEEVRPDGRVRDDARGRRVGDGEQHPVVGERGVEVADRDHPARGEPVVTNARRAGRIAVAHGVEEKVHARVQHAVGDAGVFREGPDPAVQADEKLRRSRGARGVRGKRVRVGERGGEVVDAQGLRSGGRSRRGGLGAAGEAGRPRRIRAVAQVAARSGQAGRRKSRTRALRARHDGSHGLLKRPGFGGPQPHRREEEGSEEGSHRSGQTGRWHLCSRVQGERSVVEAID